MKYEKSHRLSRIMTLAFAVIFAGFVGVAEAAPLYTPGQTLNPTCDHTDPDCAVAPVVNYFSNSSASTTLTTGTNFIASLGYFGSVVATSSASSTILTLSTTNFYTDAIALGASAISYIQGLFTQGTGISISGGTITNTGVTALGGLTGSIATSSLGLLGSSTAASTYVPYTGATAGLNLGSQTLTTTGQTSLGNASTTSFTSTGATYLATAGGNVGIGTTGPLSKLDISGGVAVGSYAGANAAPSNGLIVSGNVGIGTTSPSVALDVNGSGQFNNDVIINNFSGAKGYRLNDGSVNRLFARYEGTGTGIQTSFAKYLRFGTGADDIRFYDGSSATVPSLNLISGNVGIGTTNPNVAGFGAGTTILTIRGSGTTGTSLGGVEVVGNGSDASGNAAGIFDFLAGSNNAGHREIAQLTAFTIGSTANDRGGYFVFSTKPNGSAAAVENMRLSSTGGLSLGTATWNGTDPGAGNLAVQGNVGIGTVSPAYKLQVSGGDVGIDNGHFYRANRNTSSSSIDVMGFPTGTDILTFMGGVGANSNIGHQFVNTAGTVLMSILGNGNIDIGTTTTPGTKLSLGDQGGTLHSADTTNTKIAVYEFNGTSIYGIGLSHATNYGLGLFANSTSAGSPNVFIESTGNVGIGTTTMANKLAVYGGASIGATYENVAAPTDGMIIKGNVGIGTTSPTAKLSVWKTSGSSGDIFHVSSTTSGDLLTINSSGNVGIGTTTPNALLVVSSGLANSVMKVNNTGGSAGQTSEIQLTQSVWSGRTTLIQNILQTGGTYSNLNITQQGNVALSILGKNGNVGIGTTSPATKLDVAGDITDENVKGCNSVTSVLQTDNTGLVFCDTSFSDARLKTNIESLDSSSTLQGILYLNPITYTWNSLYFDTSSGKYSNQTPTSENVGFLAQDVQKVFPELVDSTGQGTSTYLSVDYAHFVPVIVSAIQALSSKVDSLVQNGIATIQNLVVDTLMAVHITTTDVTAEKLCLGQTCVTEAQLKQLLQNENVAAAAHTSSAQTQSVSPDPSISTQTSTATTTTVSTSTTTPDATSTPAPVTVSTTTSSSIPPVSKPDDSVNSPQTSTTTDAGTL